MRLLSLFFALVIPFYVFATNNTGDSPLTPEERAKLEKFTKESHLVDCLVTYKFDFFASELGLAVEESGQKTESELVTQLRNYLKSGKLEQIRPKERVSKEVAQRCDIIAQTVIELWAIRMQGQGNDPQ